MRVMKNDALYHRSKSLEKCLHTAEREKKKKYLESCLQQCCKFYLSIILVDGILNVEAEATPKQTASHRNETESAIFADVWLR